MEEINKPLICGFDFKCNKQLVCGWFTRKYNKSFWPLTYGCEKWRGKVRSGLISFLHSYFFCFLVNGGNTHYQELTDVWPSRTKYYTYGLFIQNTHLQTKLCMPICFQLQQCISNFWCTKWGLSVIYGNTVKVMLATPTIRPEKSSLQPNNSQLHSS